MPPDLTPIQRILYLASTADANNPLDAEIALRRIYDLARPLDRPIIVEVVGGVAGVTDCPDGIEVRIIDHDDPGER